MGFFPDVYPSFGLFFGNLHAKLISDQILPTLSDRSAVQVRTDTGTGNNFGDPLAGLSRFTPATDNAPLQAGRFALFGIVEARRPLVRPGEEALVMLQGRCGCLINGGPPIYTALSVSTTFPGLLTENLFTGSDARRKIVGFNTEGRSPNQLFIDCVVDGVHGVGMG